MATVFLTKDLKHNRNVALKVLKPELAKSATTASSRLTRVAQRTGCATVERDLGLHRRVLIPGELLAASDIHTAEQGSPDGKEHD